MAQSITDGVVALVSAGFDEDKVLHEWPYDKFELFRKAALRRDIEHRKDFTIDVATAVGGVLGGKNAVTGHLKNLDEFIEDEL